MTDRTSLFVALALCRFCRMVLWLRFYFGRQHPIYQANTARLAADLDRLEQRIRERRTQ